MTQLQENVRTDGRMDRQTLFYRTLPPITRGPKIVLVCIRTYASIMDSLRAPQIIFMHFQYPKTLA